MQNIANAIARRWRSGWAGKLLITTAGLILGCCLCTVPFAFVDKGAPATRSRPPVEIEPTATREIRPTSSPIPTHTAAPPTDMPARATDTPVPPTPAPTNTPPPAPTSTPLPPAPPAVRGGNEVNPFTCTGGCTEPPDPSCAIKGNISISTGDKIYHMPGQRNYDDTEISPEFGERWFCTPAEAEAAGWRAAKR